MKQRISKAILYEYELIYFCTIFVNDFQSNVRGVISSYYDKTLSVIISLVFIEILNLIICYEGDQRKFNR